MWGTATGSDNDTVHPGTDAVAFARYDANFLVRGGTFEAPEGPARTRHVVIEFESYEQALACYRSPEYLAAARLRQAYAESDLVIVEGTD